MRETETQSCSALSFACIATEKWQVLVSDAAGSPFWEEVAGSRSALLT